VKGSGSLLTNPALLAGEGSWRRLRATDHGRDHRLSRATIDEDSWRAPCGALLFEDMIGVGFDIEAMTIRAHEAGSARSKWSKSAGHVGDVARTQAYALRQLDALAEKDGAQDQDGDLARDGQEPSQNSGWLFVLARCFQLQDAIAVSNSTECRTVRTIWTGIAPPDCPAEAAGRISQSTARLMATWMRLQARPA